VIRLEVRSHLHGAHGLLADVESYVVVVLQPQGSLAVFNDAEARPSLEDALDLEVSQVLNVHDEESAVKGVQV